MRLKNLYHLRRIHDGMPIGIGGGFDGGLEGGSGGWGGSGRRFGVANNDTIDGVSIFIGSRMLSDDSTIQQSTSSTISTAFVIGVFGSTTRNS